MSFSPYQVLLGLAETHSQISDEAAGEQGSSGSGRIEIQSSNDGDESSVSFHDTLSLNSETLQDFGSLVTLPPGTISALFNNSAENDDGSHTIVSSAPSGAYIPAPEASQDAWAVSPHPSLVPGHVQSLPTVCTDTLSYQDLTADDASSKSSVDENNAIIIRARSRMSSMSNEEHDPVTFMAVANNLMRDSINNKDNCWYAKFTEYDWEQFRDVAKMVLATLEPKPPILPLPPIPPALFNSMDEGASDDSRSYSAEDHLPLNFVCPLCKDVIVGALTLECGCTSSTVCSSCWEKHTEVPHEMSDELDYVWVNQKECPNCRAQANSYVPCHALDHAILRIVQSLSHEAENLKRSYYSRLKEWRLAVLKRNTESSQQETARHDELLARLIHEEEKVLWGKQRCQQKAIFNPTLNVLFLGQTALALIAATVASVGLKALTRR